MAAPYQEFTVENAKRVLYDWLTAGGTTDPSSSPPSLGGASGAVRVFDVDFATVVLDAFVPMLAVAADDQISLAIYNTVDWDQAMLTDLGSAGDPTALTSNLNFQVGNAGPVVHEANDVIGLAVSAFTLGYTLHAAGQPTTGHAKFVVRIESPA